MPQATPSPAERRRFQLAPAGHSDPTPRPRGPKDRPQIRLEQHATWRVRMRAWCNELKSALLGSIHDPSEPQTYRVIQQPHCPISNASTWLTWWSGEAVPRPRHVAAAAQIAPGSAHLLDLHDLQTPLQRNLYAIDLLRRRIFRPLWVAWNRGAGDAQSDRRSSLDLGR
jgi:hypothetical protein